MGEKLLTTKEVSERLGVTVNTLQIWRHQGKGPEYIKLSRRAIRYRERAIQDYENRATVEIMA